VYKPFTTVPTFGLSDQVTAVFEVPVTVATNWLFWPAVKPRAVGYIETLTGVTLTDLMRLSLAAAVTEVSATLVAMSLMVCAALMSRGAVYKPFTTVPTFGLNVQVTAVFELPVTVVTN
jgi:hypothetical protein